VGQEDGVALFARPVSSSSSRGMSSRPYVPPPVGNLCSWSTGLVEERASWKRRAEIFVSETHARPVDQVDLLEFQPSHEIAILIGSPPGIPGTPGDRPPVDHAGAVAQISQGKNLKLMLFCCFDEIEKRRTAPVASCC